MGEDHAVSGEKPEGGDGRGKGRPSIFTPEIAATICARLAHGESLRAVCRGEGMPAESTVRSWALDDHEGFSAQFMRARDIGYCGMFDELLEIADTPKPGVIITEKPTGTETRSADMIEHRRLQVDTRKWVLSKALPKLYGDKVTADVAVTHTNPASPLELARGLAFVLASAQQAVATPPIPGTSTSNSKG